MKFSIEDTKVKHTKITTICKEYYFLKLLNIKLEGVGSEA
jgi:hypothetical protein